MNRPAPILYFFAGRMDVPEKYTPRFEAYSFTPGFKIGPKGSEGLGFIVSPFSGVSVELDEECQRWEQIDSGVWIGVRHDLTVNDFLRPVDRLVLGEMVALGDGREWLVPIANPLVESCTLPFVWRYKWCKKAENKIRYRDIQERFREVSLKAEELGQAYYQANIDLDFELSISIDDDEADEFFWKVVSINYDLTFDEFQAMGVFTPDAYVRMITTLIDQEGIEDIAAEVIRQKNEEVIFPSKKNSSSHGGGPVSPQNTPPQSPMLY